MNVREMIQEMAKEPDMDCEVYVRLVADNGTVTYMQVDGVAQIRDSFKKRTTLIVEPLPG